MGLKIVRGGLITFKPTLNWRNNARPSSLLRKSNATNTNTGRGSINQNKQRLRSKIVLQKSDQFQNKPKINDILSKKTSLLVRRNLDALKTSQIRSLKLYRSTADNTIFSSSCEPNWNFFKSRT